MDRTARPGHRVTVAGIFGFLFCLTAGVVRPAQAQTIPPAAFPGKVQAEDFRSGGQGVAYSDTTTGNQGGVYRATDVDIQTTTDTGGGFNVGWTVAGEWLAYDVTVNQTALYNLTVRVASFVSGTKTMRVDVDGTTVATLNTTTAAGWQSWTSVTANNISLTSGTHLVRITLVTGSLNFNWFEAAAQAPGTLGFSAASYSVAENVGSATITVTRLDGTSGTVSAAYATSNGSASAGSDYTASSGTLTFANGVTTQSLTVPITDDTATEGSETINLTLSAPSGGAVLRSPTTVAVTIADNDGVALPSLPATIQAEDFINGGQGIAYNDTTPGNTGGAYRPTDVDIQATMDSGGGFNIGWIVAGEWLAYDVNVSAANAGAYKLMARVASGTAGSKTLRFDVDGTAVATLSFTDASGFQSWRSVVAHNINLTAGNHRIRVNMITGGFNLNWWQVAPNDAPIAAAGPDQTTIVRRLVTLDGSASRDPDSGPQALTYQWAQVSGPAVTLSSSTTARPTFTPTVTGSYEFRLTAGDGALTATDNVVVTVTADPAVAGPLTSQRVIFAVPNLDYGYLAQPPIFYNGEFGEQIQAFGDFREYHQFSATSPYASRTVDMSVFDCYTSDRFPPIATDSSNVPLNGIFFRPSGTGPFPIAFFLHGAHVPVERSEPGYEEAAAYLASHGVFSVTVDQNYANSACGNGGRAVLLLEAIKQFRIWNTTSGHPLFGKIDLNRIMIVGHSRGGEAVEHASFFNQRTKDGATTLRPFPNLPEFEGFNDPVPVDGSGPLGPWQFNLQAVVALAPTDGMYRPVNPGNDTQVVFTSVRDNFFLIYGSRDADVTRFEGHQAYDRASPFAATSPVDTTANVKGHLYLFSGNHNYFNKIWALRPDGSGRCLHTTCYDPALQLSLADQHSIFKTWLASLSFTFLLNRPEHMDVLRHKPALASALPASGHTVSGATLPIGFYSQFQDKHRRMINHYQEDTNIATLSPMPPGISGGNEIQAGLTASEMPLVFEFGVVPGRYFTQETRGLSAKWGASGTRAYRSFVTSALPLTTGSGQALTHLALHIGFTPEETQNAAGVNQNFSVWVRDSANNSTTVTGAELFGSVPVLPYPILFAAGERTNKPHPVIMQTVRFPLALFGGRGVNPAGIVEIQLRFDRTSSGSAYLDEIQLTR